MDIPLKFPLKSPLKVDVTFLFDAADDNFKLWGVTPIKKDIDNLLKFVFDALNAVVWDDDRFIVECHAVKKWAKNNRVIIEVEIMEDELDDSVIRYLEPYEVEELTQDSKNLTTTFKISDFAKKWGDKLNKIKKMAEKKNVDKSR